MSKIDIPVVVTGPGSQPAEEDGAGLEYVQMPAAMETFAVPDLPERADTLELAAAKRLLRRLQEMVVDYRIGEPSRVLDLTGLDDANRSLVDQVLGEGEVGVVLRGDLEARIQESVLAGIWRVQYPGESGALRKDMIEVAAIPRLVREAAFPGAVDRLAREERSVPEGVLNASSLMAELAAKVADYQPGMAAHVINLSLLPQTEQDLDYLVARLGRGAAAILSRGYGNCRISSTATRNVWWVQYFNSQDAMILNTLEVVDVPSVACAAQEDIADSALRLGEILDVYL